MLGVQNIALWIYISPVQASLVTILRGNLGEASPQQALWLLGDSLDPVLLVLRVLAPYWGQLVHPHRLHPRIWHCGHCQKAGVGIFRHENWAFPGIFQVGGVGVDGMAVAWWVTCTPGVLHPAPAQTYNPCSSGGCFGSHVPT